MNGAATTTPPESPAPENRSHCSRWRFGPPCGCLAAGECVHVDHDAPRLREPVDAGPGCHHPEGDRYACGRFTVQQLVSIGLSGRCCREVSP